MRRSVLFGAAVALMTSPVFAASPETEAFVAKTRLSVSFLTEASALVADRSDNAVVRDVAEGELTAGPSLVSTLARRAVEDDGRSGDVAMMGDGVLTGRSVATGASAAGFAPPSGTGAMMPAALITIERLVASKGGAFDALYVASQRAVLDDLEASFEAYDRTGDDAVLRQVARHELDAIRTRLAALATVKVEASRRD